MTPTMVSGDSSGPVVPPVVAGHGHAVVPTVPPEISGTDSGPAIDPRLDRKNGRLFLWTNITVYFAAPVLYVGVTQAAFCFRLGASAAIANLPGFGLFPGARSLRSSSACLVPQRLDRQVVSVTGALMAVLLAAVAATLFLPMSNQIRIDVVIGQSLVLGFLNSVSQVYLYQCLGRGTTEAGRARALKIAFTIGPLAAVAGSLLAQFILRRGIPHLSFPRDFGVLYLIATACMGIFAWCASRMELAPLAEAPLPSFFSSLRDSFRHYFRSRELVLLLLAAYSAFSLHDPAMPNLSLYTRQAMGREPSEFSGVVLTLRFGCKALAGYGLGVLNLRYGARASLATAAVLIALSMVWAQVVPGYLYLGSFGLIGAGELGGAFFSSALLSWSLPIDAVRDMSILNLAVPAAVAPRPACMES